MLADTATLVWTVVAVAFAFATVGWVLYALVRPFTHRGYRHQDGLWTHLP